ncbi:MAG TPA: hypothetical protein PLC98_08845 [Anaerolineales bacterium]|nr:hypothetical protein [Anaerolineales bacterium]
MTSHNPRIGSSLEAWLDADGIHGDVDAIAAKRDLVTQLETARRQRRLTRAALAQKARISAIQLRRLLDPDHTDVSVRALARVALALGKGLTIGLC